MCLKCFHGGMIKTERASYQPNISYCTHAVRHCHGSVCLWLSTEQNHPTKARD